MPEKDRIPSDYSSNILSAAKIPKDSSLDLLHADASINAGLLRNINVVLEPIYTELTLSYVEKLGTGSKLTSLISNYISHNKEISDKSVYLDDLFIYLGIFINRKGNTETVSLNLSHLLGDEEKQNIEKCLGMISEDRVLSIIRNLTVFVDETTQNLKNSRKLFY